MMDSNNLSSYSLEKDPQYESSRQNIARILKNRAEDNRKRGMSEERLDAQL